MGYFDGFWVTLKKLFEFPRLTKNYVKDEGGKRDKPERLHGRHVLNRYEDGDTWIVLAVSFGVLVLGWASIGAALRVGQARHAEEQTDDTEGVLV